MYNYGNLTLRKSKLNQIIFVFKFDNFNKKHTNIIFSLKKAYIKYNYYVQVLCAAVFYYVKVKQNIKFIKIITKKLIIFQ